LPDDQVFFTTQIPKGKANANQPCQIRGSLAKAEAATLRLGQVATRLTRLLQAKQAARLSFAGIQKDVLCGCVLNDAALSVG